MPPLTRAGLPPRAHAGAATCGAGLTPPDSASQTFRLISSPASLLVSIKVRHVCREAASPKADKKGATADADAVPLLKEDLAEPVGSGSSRLGENGFRSNSSSDLKAQQAFNRESV